MKFPRTPRLFIGIAFVALCPGISIGLSNAAEVTVISGETNTVFPLDPAEATDPGTPTFAGLSLSSQDGRKSVSVRRLPVKPGETYTCYIGGEDDVSGATFYLFGIDPQQSPPRQAPPPLTTRALRLDPARWGEASFARYNVTVAPQSSGDSLYLVALFEPGSTAFVAEFREEAVPDLLVEDTEHVEDPQSLSDEWQQRHADGTCMGWLFDQQLIVSATSDELSGRGSSSVTDSSGEPEPYAVVKVFFGTDRNRTGETKPSEYFGPDRGEMALGICDVSIPRDHRIGQLERPSIWKLDFRETPEKHVVVLSLEELKRDSFVSAVQDRVNQSEEKQAFVFVHGYNVSFDSAVMRAAQVHYDLAFDGAPIVYSWPSKGSITGYPADEATIEWTLPHLESFLTMVTEESGAEKLHLVAHSMGNRALVRTLVRLFEKNGELPGNIENIVLTAPDIDAEVFTRDFAPQLVNSGKPVTLYASDSDNALIASKKIHQAPRAGDTADGLVILDGMDTIDASGKSTDFLGHSYFANSRTVIGDLFKLIRGYTPDRRHGLRQGTVEPEGIFWFFRDRKTE